MLAFGILVASGWRCMADEAGNEWISIPLRFHIVRGMQMKKRDVTLKSWISADDLRAPVLAEANRIWRPAQVRWTLAETVIDHVAASPEAERTAAFLLGATRDSTGRSDPRRIRMLDKLLDTARADGPAVDVYLVPYLGERSQGNAGRKKRRVFLTQWTDKPSRGKRPPERFPLVEPEPFRKGSLGRTLAHELGHILGLRHPDKKTQRVFGRLMGGKRAGYQLTAAEIEAARATAREIARSGEAK